MAQMIYNGTGFGNVPNLSVNGYWYNLYNIPAQDIYYAGTFFIDTGYDDPVAWSQSYDITELYTARVYPASGNHYPALGASEYVGVIFISAAPTWTTTFYESPASGVASSRVYIKCDCWIKDKNASVSQFRLNSVNWALYRT